MSSPKLKVASFAMERMKAKDEEDRLERVNTKQKRGTPTRDIGLQKKVLFWIMDTLDEKPKGKTDYDHWLSDGTILVRVLQSVMFNSVPIDVLDSTKSSKLEPHHPPHHPDPHANNNNNSNHSNETSNHKDDENIRKNTEERIRLLLKYLKRYGVPEKFLFEPDDLTEMRNMPKITRCIGMLAKMAGVSSFSDCNIEIPDDDSHFMGSDED